MRGSCVIVPGAAPGISLHVVGREVRRAVVDACRTKDNLCATRPMPMLEPGAEIAAGCAARTFPWKIHCRPPHTCGRKLHRSHDAFVRARMSAGAADVHSVSLSPPHVQDAARLFTALHAASGPGLRVWRQTVAPGRLSDAQMQPSKTNPLHIALHALRIGAFAMAASPICDLGSRIAGVGWNPVLASGNGPLACSDAKCRCPDCGPPSRYWVLRRAGQEQTCRVPQGAPEVDAMQEEPQKAPPQEWQPWRQDPRVGQEWTVAQ